MVAENQAGDLQDGQTGIAMNFIVGLTGGIGSGKTTVADIFSSLGITVVDTDVIAHELTGVGGAAMPEITAAFGPDVLQEEGGLDRAAMRRRVFADPSVRKRLESILHPKIRHEAEVRCQSAISPYVLLVVPLLIETGAYRHFVKRLLVVDCDETVQISRVMTRSGLSPDEVRTIMAAQTSRTERLAVADDVVCNGEDRAALEPQVIALHQRYLRLSLGEKNDKENDVEG